MKFNFRNIKPKTRILIISGLLFILASSIATYVYLSGINSKKLGEFTANPEVLAAQDETEYDFGEIPEDESILNVLLLGYGGPGHSGGFLADAIQVVHFDFDEEKIAFISIPRDLWVKLPNGKSDKINRAFSLGNSSDPINSGAQISKQMARVVTGLAPKYFISIDFVGFQRAIGYELGGITVNVPEALDDPWYPVRGREQETCGKSPDEVAQLTAQYSGFELERQFECRYDHIKFGVGKHKMEGGDALAYVRSRHGSAGGDFSRSQRQQALLLAIRDKIFSLEALKNIPGFFKQMIKHTNTDFDVESIKYLAPLLAKTDKFEVVNITLSTENTLSNSKSSSGQYIVVPKAGINSWEQVQSYIQTELNK